MARSVNKVTLLGNVGKDPEIRSSASGIMVANLTLATSDNQKDAQGNWQEHTEWHNLVAFKRTAEIVRDYVKKGSKLYIEGKITTRSWDERSPVRSAIRPKSSSMNLFCSPPARKAQAPAALQVPAVRQPASTSARPPAKTTPSNPPKSPTTISPSRGCYPEVTSGVNEIAPCAESWLAD